MNAIGYAHYQLNGGTARLWRWTAATAVLGAAALVFWARSGGAGLTLPYVTGPLALALGVLLIIHANIRIAGAIRRDATLDMSRSHRLMPQSAPSAVLGYILGSTLSVLAAAGVVVLLGTIGVLVNRGNPAAWLMACGILASFAAMTWCFSASASFAGTGRSGGARRSGGIGWVPWAILGPMFATGGAVLALLPWLAVLLSPLIGRTAFALRRPDQITWAHGVSALLQMGLAAIFFAAACRRYRRDDGPGLSPPLWLAFIAIIIVGTIIGLASFEDFRPAPFDDLEATPRLAIPATLTLLLLLIAGPIGAAEQSAIRWRYRRNVGDPYAAESRPALPSWGVLLACLGLALPLVAFAPDDVYYGTAAAEARFERSLWLHTWLLSGSAFACGAVFLWGLIRASARLDGPRFVVWALFVFWVLPFIGAAGWALARDGALDQATDPPAAFSTIGAIWTAWTSLAPAVAERAGDAANPGAPANLDVTPLAAHWMGVAFQALLAAAAVIFAWRVPDRAAQPATRE